jgi:hypothetical protein
VISIVHATFASDGRHALFPDLASQRQALHAVARVAKKSLLLFCFVDDHLHVVFRALERRVGRIVAGLTLALRPIAAAPLGRAFVRRVATRHHLEWLADTYILRQAEKHGLPGPLALREGSCFLDLVGARVLPGIALDEQLLVALPRYLLRRAYRAVGLEETLLEPLEDAAIRALGAARVFTAAQVALAARPGARGNGRAERSCRRVAVQLCRQVGIASGECRFAVGIGRSAYSRLARARCDRRLATAVRLRLALEERVR